MFGTFTILQQLWTCALLVASGTNCDRFKVEGPEMVNADEERVVGELPSDMQWHIIYRARQKLDIFICIAAACLCDVLPVSYERIPTLIWSPAFW